MNKTEKIALTLIGVGVVTVVLFNMKNGAVGPINVAGVANDIIGVSQTGDDIGPTYLVANLPYGYGPPVTMQAPVTSQGFQGQSAPLFDTTCGCK